MINLIIELAIIAGLAIPAFNLKPVAIATSKKAAETGGHWLTSL